MVQRRENGLVRRLPSRENISRVSPTGFSDRPRSQVETELRKTNDRSYQLATGISEEDI
ncbi:MAG: hypothetical protein ACYCX4_10085 [Bacillota bacterium]